MMSLLLPKIYPITDCSISKLSHLEQVKCLIDGGANFIQLRDKHSTPKNFYQSAKEVMDFINGNEVKILINDRIDIALAVKADGVHLGQDDLSPAHARKILGEKAIIGFSTHSVSQAIEATNFPIDYVAIGPIFATSTKENPDPVVGIEGLKVVRQAIGNFPIVAIGGIQSSNASSILQNGADSLALISAILRDSGNISGAYHELNKHL